MALPLLVLSVMVVGTLLGFVNVTVKTATLPSTTVGLLMLTVGFTSLSVIVAVPVAVVFAVFVDVTVAPNVKFSVGSAVVSSVVGTLTVTLVAPAGMVIVVVVVV